MKSYEDGSTCSVNETIQVINNPFDFTHEIDVTCCAVEVTFEITSSMCANINPENVNLKIVDPQNDVIFDNIPVVQDENNILRYNVQLPRPKRLDSWLSAEIEFIGDENVAFAGDCSYEILLGNFPNTAFRSPWRSFFPKTFTPNFDGLNDTFHPTLLTFEPNPSSDICDHDPIEKPSSLISAKLEIWNRWGESIYTGETITTADCADSHGVNPQTIAWDGIQDGGPIFPDFIENGVYIYEYTATSCANSTTCPITDHPCLEEDNFHGECLFNEPGVSVQFVSGKVVLVK